MSTYLNKLLQTAKTPLYSKDGIIEAFTLSLDEINYNNRFDSRFLQFAGHKEPIKTTEDNNFLSDAKKNILWQNVLALQADYKNTNLSPETLKLSTVFSQMPHQQTIKLLGFVDILNLKTKEEAWQYFSQPGYSHILESLTSLSSANVGTASNTLYTKQQFKYPYNKYRIYLNAPTGKAKVEFLEKYICKCIENRIPYHMTNFNNIEDFADTNELNSTILFATKENLEKTIQILEQLKQENPELINGFGTPNPTTLQLSYYGITRDGSQNSSNLFFNTPLISYGEFANKVILLANYSLCCNVIKNNSRIFNSLSKKEQQQIEKFESFNFECSLTEFEKTYLKNLNEQTKNIRNIIQKNPAIFTELRNNEQMWSEFENRLKLASSYCAFGDLEHTNVPIALDEQFYDYFNFDPEQNFNGAKPNNKKVLSQEAFETVLISGEKTLKIQLILNGTPAVDLENKTEKELKEMFLSVARPTDKCIVDTLCSGVKNLKSILITCGLEEDVVNTLTREQLEEAYIKTIGLNETITATQNIFNDPAEHLIKRNANYLQTLKKLRYERGKQITLSEEFKFLNAENQASYLLALNPFEKEDVINVLDGKIK